MKARQRWYQRHQLFNQSVPSSLLPWLFDTSSLTSRIISLCDDDFSVTVLSQQWQVLDAEEVSVMALTGVRAALVRQVVLNCGKKPMVYARTVIPATTIQGALRRYANMGNRPLGAMLFADRTMQREAIQVARLTAEQFILAGGDKNTVVWGRRSVFRVAGKPLLVSEYFLPALVQVD